MGEIKRVMFTSYLKEDGTANKILKTDAAAKANWQTLFNKFNFSSDKLEKVVPTCLVYEFKSEQADPEAFDQGGYYEKLRDGDYNFSFMIYGRVPDYIERLKDMENNTIATYLVDADSRVWGTETSASDTYLSPIRIKNVAVQNFNMKSRETPPSCLVTMRIEVPAHINNLVSVTVADGDVGLDTDFYSLIDATGTITSPAVTGCVATIVDDAEGDAVIGLAGTGDYVYWNFYDNVAPTVAIPLAADGSISASSNVYTINEAALLTTLHVYLLKVSHPMYDIDSMTVTIP